MAENRQGAGAGAVMLLRAVTENAFEQIVVLIHGATSQAFGRTLERMLLAAGPANRQRRFG
jgi:hypothetical protein